LSIRVADESLSEENPVSRTIAAYSFGDLAGCVEQRISRQTGVKVGL
jgi:hypothetical protein